MPWPRRDWDVIPVPMFSVIPSLFPARFGMHQLLLGPANLAPWEEPWLDVRGVPGFLGCTGPLLLQNNTRALS